MEEIYVRLVNKLNQRRRTTNCLHSFIYFHLSSEAERINQYTDLCHRAETHLSDSETDFLYRTKFQKFSQAVSRSKFRDSSSFDSNVV